MFNLSTKTGKGKAYSFQHDEMQKSKAHISLSFSVRLSCYVVVVCAIVFSVAFYIYLNVARNEVKQEAREKITALLTNHVQYINGVLSIAQITARNASAAVLNNINNIDSLPQITRKLLQNNPGILGSAIAVEPGYYRNRAKYFAPYSHRVNADSIATIDFGSSGYLYQESDWFVTPKRLQESHWSEPYFDKGGADRIMITFSQPIKDSQGRFFGVLTIDLLLEWLSELVEKNKPYPNSNIVMIGRTGTFIIHKDNKKILNETIFSSAHSRLDTTLINIGNRMISGKSGSICYTKNGVDFEAFYAPVSNMGWSIALVCQSSDILEGMNRMEIVMIWIALVGLFALMIVCVLVIRHNTKPIAWLSVSARRIATGDFQTPLPNIKIDDEIGVLCRSFDYMQQSLCKYIAQLRAATEQEERINSELRIASEIQLGMIINDFSIVTPDSGLDIAATMIPAKEVGGDLYDVIVRDNKLYLLIGDVAGKGVPASLMMAVTLSLFRILADQSDNPKDMVERLNHSIIRNNNNNNMFVTLVVGVYDMPSKVLTYCNAGHNPMVILRNTEIGSVEMVDVLPNLPVGIIDDFEYVPQKLSLYYGDTLFLYTDGLTESENDKQELYSEERMVATLEQARKFTAQQIIKHVQDDVKSHSANTPQSDDLTMLVMKINTQSVPVETY